MVGMRDVAKAAGGSLSTVSLVVNNTGYVSADMRAKVESAMRQLNYIPNELARNLYRNRTNTIGVIMPTIAHPFFSTLTAHLQREFAARDLKTLLCSTADADKGEGEYVDMLQRHMMDGIIMAAHTEHPADYWTSIHRPIVAFDRTLGEGVPVVRSDHEQGGRLIARQLIDSGARHVVLVGGPRSQFAAATTFPTIRYHLTVERLLADAGIACDYVEAGAVAGLATITPCAGYVEPWAAIIIGAVGSSVCYYAKYVQERLGFDDALEVWRAHGMGGVTGALLLGILASSNIDKVNASIHQFLMQLLGVIIVAVYSFVVTIIIFKVISAWGPIRVTKEEEEAGLDESLHGEDAYKM